MNKKVLVVDDSGFFRRRLKAIINEHTELEVIDEAENGREGVEKAVALRPDVITMDIEMPVMNGIDAVREIMQKSPTPILMFSSLTHEGAQATLDALDAGAADFLPKKFDEMASNQQEAMDKLRRRVYALATQGGGAAVRLKPAVTATQITPVAEAPAATPEREVTRSASRAVSKTDFDLVMLGTSTGGPVALQNVLVTLPSSFPLPILIVQHMPAAFTGAFAERLDKICKISIREAKDGDVLEAGVVLLGPGGMQMRLNKKGRLCVEISEDTDEAQKYRPCIDVTLDSIIRNVNGRALSVIMTGMGSDGKVGSEGLGRAGGTVWAQDKESCVIYGMPAAVANMADRVLSLDDIGKELAKL